MLVGVNIAKRGMELGRALDVFSVHSGFPFLYDRIIQNSSLSRSIFSPTFAVVPLYVEEPLRILPRFQTAVPLTKNFLKVTPLSSTIMSHAKFVGGKWTLIQFIVYISRFFVLSLNYS